MSFRGPSNDSCLSIIIEVWTVWSRWNWQHVSTADSVLSSAAKTTFDCDNGATAHAESSPDRTAAIPWNDRDERQLVSTSDKTRDGLARLPATSSTTFRRAGEISRGFHANRSDDGTPKKHVRRRRRPGETRRTETAAPFLGSDFQPSFWKSVYILWKTWPAFHLNRWLWNAFEINWKMRSVIYLIIFFLCK